MVMVMVIVVMVKTERLGYNLQQRVVIGG